MFTKKYDDHFGWLTIRFLLLLVILKALVHLVVQSGEANPETVTVLSKVLPVELWANPAWHYAVQVAVILTSVLWLLGWLVPVSSWLCVLSVLAWGATKVELSHGLDHSDHWLWSLLFVHAAWHTFCPPRRVRGENGDARAAGGVYPAWVLWLSVFLIAWFHTLSGLDKWSAASPDWHSGWIWAEGRSLQLWLSDFGNRDSRLVQWLIQDSGTALAVQRGILAIELLALAALLGKWGRQIIGIALLVYYGFHLHAFADFPGLVESTFGTSTIGGDSGGPRFPEISYLIQGILVLWFFLLPDQLLGKSSRVPTEQ